MKPKIGVIAYGLERAAGGIARYNKELIAALRQIGADIITLQAGTAIDYNKTILLRGSQRLPGLMTIGQIEIARSVHRENLSIVHDPTGCVPLWFTRASRVVTIHDVIPYIYPETSSTLDWLIYQFWLPGVVKSIDSIITVSEQSKADIVRYLPVEPEKITVIPQAASDVYQIMTRKQVQQVLQRYGIDFPYILYVGSIEARKNLPCLLDAYHQLRCWSQKWKLVMVGVQKWKYSSVYSTLERLGLESNVYFTGYVQEEDLPALYNGASLFVFPSLYEGFGLPVLEAMACGTPVITSNCSSLPEVTGEAAILVDPTNVQAVASGMRQVLEEPALAAHMREKGIKRAQQFGWDQTARRTNEVYERLWNEQHLG